MISKILVEKEWLNHPRTQKVLAQFPQALVEGISSIDRFFGPFKKPYLEKRTDLNLYLGSKRGQLLKEAPDAYGLSGDPHFYYVHSYNCIYECEYCYLQGYFNNPDLVQFLNFEDIYQSIETQILKSPEGKHPWFHAGEFSDSLALSHISDELEVMHPLFEKYPQAQWELRTKSANLKKILTLKPLPNWHISFSMAPEKAVKKIEHKTAPLSLRLKALQSLHEKGYSLALHLDPIIFTENFIEDYQILLDAIEAHVPISSIKYISLGVVRFTTDVYKQVQVNYPESDILNQDLIKSFDNKVRYPKPLRLWMLEKIKSQILKFGIEPERVYLCME